MSQKLGLLHPITPVCIYCQQPREKVTRDREALMDQVRNSAGRFTYPATPAEAQEACVCCTPESDYRCLRCGSDQLDFAMHYATATWEEGEETVEMAQCKACSWTGEASECAPPLQPWAELEAVALAALPRMPAGVEDELEMARRHVPVLMEVA